MFARSLRLFLKAMQNIGNVCKLRNVENTEYAAFVLNPNLFDAFTDSIHRLPVGWFPAILHFIELIAHLTPCCGGEGAEINKAVTPKLYGLRQFSHMPIIQIFI